MRAYAYFRNRFWYLFPGSVFRFLAHERKEQRLHLAALTTTEKEEIRQQKKRNLIAFSISFVLHILFALSFFYSSVNPVFVGEDQIVKGDTVDFDIMDGMLSSDVDPVYDKSSEFIVKPSVLIKKRKDQSLTELLDKLRGLKTTGLSGKSSLKKKKYESQIGQVDYKLKAEFGWKRTKKKVSPLKVQLWDRMKTLKSGSKTSKVSKNQNVNYGQIMRVIDRHNFQFQECYERALLRDESLSGKVIFLLKLNHSQVKKAGLELQGKGSSASRRELLPAACFKRVKNWFFQKTKGIYPSNLT